MQSFWKGNKNEVNGFVWPKIFTEKEKKVKWWENSRFLTLPSFPSLALFLAAVVP